MATVIYTHAGEVLKCNLDAAKAEAFIEKLGSRFLGLVVWSNQ